MRRKQKSKLKHKEKIYCQKNECISTNAKIDLSPKFPGQGIHVFIEGFD